MLSSCVKIETLFISKTFPLDFMIPVGYLQFNFLMTGWRNILIVLSKLRIIPVIFYSWAKWDCTQWKTQVSWLLIPILFSSRATTNQSSDDRSQWIWFNLLYFPCLLPQIDTLTSKCGNVVPTAFPAKILISTGKSFPETTHSLETFLPHPTPGGWIGKQVGCHYTLTARSVQLPVLES